MPVYKYTDEIISVIKDNADKGYKNILKILNEKYGMDTNYETLVGKCSDYGIVVRPYQKSITYYIKEFIKENHHKYLAKEMLDILNQKFNINLTKSALNHYYVRMKIPFKFSGPAPIGTEVIMSKRIYIKYQELPAKDHWEDRRLNYMPKSKYMYIQHNGSAPENCCFIHLNGDLNDFSKDNIRAVHKSVMPRITKLYGQGIITEAMIEICTLEEEIKRITKGE